MARKPLTRRRYVVGLNTPDGVVEHEIEITPADQLRAEVEGQKVGVRPDQPISFTGMCIWRGLVRLGLYEHGRPHDWHRFIDQDVFEWEHVPHEDGEEAEAVDPTYAADRSPSASPSPSGSEEAPTGGSTPTSTSTS